MSFGGGMKGDSSLKLEEKMVEEHTHGAGQKERREVKKMTCGRKILSLMSYIVIYFCVL